MHNKLERHADTLHEQKTQHKVKKNKTYNEIKPKQIKRQIKHSKTCTLSYKTTKTKRQADLKIPNKMHNYIFCKQTRSIINFYASFLKEGAGKSGHNNGRSSCSKMCI